MKAADISTIIFGLRQLPTYVGSASVDAILKNSRLIFEDLVAEIYMFSAYKKYHGVLHDLQVRTYEFPFELENSGSYDHYDFANLYLFLSHVVHCDHQLLRLSLLKDDGSKRVSSEIKPSLEKIAAMRARYELLLAKSDASGAPKPDVAGIVALMRSLKQVVRDTQVALNAGLIGAATSLRLDELSTVVQHVAQVLGDSDEVAPLKSAGKNLGQAHVMLKQLADVHDDWQGIENELIYLGDRLELIGRSDSKSMFRLFGMEWPGIRDEIMKVSAADSAAIWSKGLGRSLSDTDDELAKEAADMAEVSRHFGVCRDLVRKLFYALDEEIIRLCDDLSDLRDPVMKITPAEAP